MFAWYQRAAICYAFLSDVPGGISKHGHIEKDSHFRKSKWFTRGWTLQELLAPREVVFFDSEWSAFGFKSTWDMQVMLTDITGIKTFDEYMESSIAQKMSWVSRRETTRVEDMAYCLLGLFGVHMPPLYGEEEHAFHRLQLEILKISDDESIFAWKASQKSALLYPHRDLLARSPSEFAHAGNIARSWSGRRELYAMTNKGMHINMPMRLLTYHASADDGTFVYSAQLACRNGHSTISIYLCGSKYTATLARIFPDEFTMFPNWLFDENDSHVGSEVESLSRCLFAKRKRIRTGSMRPEELMLALGTSGSSYVRDDGFPHRTYIDFQICDPLLCRGLKEIGRSLHSRSLWVECAPFHFKLSVSPAYPLTMHFSFPGKGQYAENFCINLPITRLRKVSVKNKVSHILSTSLRSIAPRMANDDMKMQILWQNDYYTRAQAPHIVPLVEWTDKDWSVFLNQDLGTLHLDIQEGSRFKLSLVKADAALPGPMDVGT